MIDSNEKWKYLAIALTALLVAGFAVPQAFAHIATSAEQMLEHIYKFKNYSQQRY